MDISVVVPLFNEEESLPHLAEWIERVMNENNFSYEVLMIDDGSKDNSWKVIEELSQKNPNIKGVKFRRNYGKSAALNVGFERVEGDVVITMDADLQDSPDEIPELYRMITEDGYDFAYVHVEAPDEMGHQGLVKEKIEAIEKQKAILKQSIEEAETLFNSRMDYYFN